MPLYKAPVSDTVFLLTDVFDFQRYSNLPRFAEAPIDVVEAVLSEGGKFAEEVLQPLNLPATARAASAARRLGDDAERLQGGLQGLCRGRLGRHLRRAANMAGRACRTFSSVALSEYTIAANQAFAMYPGLTNGAVGGACRCMAQRRAEGALSAEDDLRRVDRHDEPDRAALRHRPRA